MSEIHAFKIEHATEFKSERIAIMITHFAHWIGVNQRANRHFIDGRTWTYQTMEEIQAVYPYWSIDQIKRLLNKMEELKIIRKGNFNKVGFDRTCWYSFEIEKKFTLGRNRQMESAESPNGLGEIARPIPDTKPVPNPDAKPTNQPYPSKKGKRQVGSSDEEKEAMRKILLSMRMVEKGSPDKERFSPEEVDVLLEGFSCERIRDAAIYLKSKKKRPVSEKGYFLNTIYKGYKI